MSVEEKKKEGGKRRIGLVELVASIRPDIIPRYIMQGRLDNRNYRLRRKCSGVPGARNQTHPLARMLAICTNTRVPRIRALARITHHLALTLDDVRETLHAVDACHMQITSGSSFLIVAEKSRQNALDYRRNFTYYRTRYRGGYRSAILEIIGNH